MSNDSQPQRGKVGESAVFHLAVFAIAFAQQVGRGRTAVGDFGDVHADKITTSLGHSKAILKNYMTTLRGSKKTVR